MAKKKHGKLARLIEDGLMTAEEAKKEFAERYNKKTPTMAKNWEGARTHIPDRWAEAVSRLIGASVDPTFKDALKAGLESGAKIYPKAIQGKGEKLVKRYVEKLTAKVAG